MTSLKSDSGATDAGVKGVGGVNACGGTNTSECIGDELVILRDVGALIRWNTPVVA